MPLTRPRDFSEVDVLGAFECKPGHAGNPIELSDSCFGNLENIEQLMVINERKSPFDFEEGDIIVLVEGSVFNSVSVLSDGTSSTTQPGSVNKTSADTIKARTSSSTSVAANTSGKAAAQINSSIGKITF